MNNPLINGKDQTKGIVGLEVEGDKAILFIQGEDGVITKHEKPHRYWLLSNENLGKGRRMQGDLHYKYGYQFTDKQELYPFKNKNRNADFYQIYDDREAHMVLFGETFFKGLKHDQVSVLAFDIETTGLFHNKDSKVLLISNTFRDSTGVVTRKLFSYDEFEDPKEMLDSWCDWVRECDPSIICGHNIYSYDLRYLEYIASQNNTALRLGREGQALEFANYDSRFRKDGSQTIGYNKVKIFGRACIDTMFLSIKYDVARNFTSYGLKSIIKELGKEIDGRVFYDAAKIKDNYQVPEEWAKIKQYAEHDGDDALTLYDLMSAPLFYLAQAVPKTYQAMLESASGSQINSIMVRAYLQDGYSIPKANDVVPFQGAISASVAGIYKNCVRWDVAGLYPSIMRQYKVYSEHKDPKAYFLALTEFLTTERLKNKKLAKDTGDKYFDDLQSSQKVTANSLYGFLSTSGLNFNFPQGASFITQKGREILTTAVEWATGDKFESWPGSKKIHD